MIKNFTTVLFIVSFLLVKTNIASAQVNTQDSLAIVDFYNSTDGPHWTNHTNWLTKKSLKSWYGVVIKNNRITKINLGNNMLKGGIPPGLGNLINLVTLILDNNQLNSIPPELGNLNKLNTLDLSNNQLSGEIPDELGNLNKLISLILSNNQLSGEIPSELGNLSELRYLDLSNNQLSGEIPNTLNLLSCLKIYLNNNQLSGKLINFSNTPHQVWISLENNKFTFAGLLKLERRYAIGSISRFTYYPQAHIPIHTNGNVLSVYTGGDYQLNFDVFYWYRNGNLVATIKNDSTFTPANNGKYNVFVTNSVAGSFLYSDTINYSTGDNLVAYKMNNNSSISLSPNPAKTNAMLSFYADGKYSITITDISGKILQTKSGVANKGTNNIQIDVSKYASGMYLITVTDEKNKKQTLRLNKE